MFGLESARCRANIMVVVVGYELLRRAFTGIARTIQRRGIYTAALETRPEPRNEDIIIQEAQADRDSSRPGNLQT